MKNDNNWLISLSIFVCFEESIFLLECKLTIFSSVELSKVHGTVFRFNCVSAFIFYVIKEGSSAKQGV